IDTAGIREEVGDSLESEGIARGRSAAEAADLIVRVFDASAPESPSALFSELLVINKIDLKPSITGRRSEFSSAVLVSARSGDGLEQLAKKIAFRLVPAPPQPGEAVPIAPTHASIIERYNEAFSC